MNNLGCLPPHRAIPSAILWMICQSHFCTTHHHHSLPPSLRLPGEHQIPSPCLQVKQVSLQFCIQCQILLQVSPLNEEKSCHVKKVLTDKQQMAGWPDYIMPLVIYCWWWHRHTNITQIAICQHNAAYLSSGGQWLVQSLERRRHVQLPRDCAGNFVLHIHLGPRALLPDSLHRSPHRWPAPINTCSGSQHLSVICAEYRVKAS